MQAIDGNSIRHIANISKIMLPVICASNQAGADGFAAGRHEGAVAYNKCSLPSATVVTAQIDEASAVNGAIFYDEDATADGIDPHVP